MTFRKVKLSRRSRRVEIGQFFLLKDYTFFFSFGAEANSHAPGVAVFSADSDRWRDLVAFVCGVFGSVAADVGGGAFLVGGVLASENVGAFFGVR